MGVDPLLDLILGLKLPSEPPKPTPGAGDPENAKLFDLAASVTWSEQTDFGKNTKNLASYFLLSLFISFFYFFLLFT